MDHQLKEFNGLIPGLILAMLEAAIRSDNLPTDTALPSALHGRIAHLGDTEPIKGSCILYVMSRDQRVQDNHALAAAQHHAKKLRLPLIVQFNVLRATGVRAQEHFTFMADGLDQVSIELKELGIPFVMTLGSPFDEISKLCDLIKPAALYLDFSPLVGPRRLAKSLGQSIHIPCFVVDTHNIVPAWIASRSEEYAAHTFRPKIHRLLEQYIVEPPPITTHPFQLLNIPTGTTLLDIRGYIKSIPPCGIQVAIAPGMRPALDRANQFIRSELGNYASGRNDMANDKQSGLSPYLHFGHISSLRIALEVMYDTAERPMLFDQSKMAQSSGETSKIDGMNVLFEEMIVRKELADNFCLYSSSYRNLSGARTWARNSLLEHINDPRVIIYDQKELEQAHTHDQSWNAAQNQLTKSGKMHGYMRMYWAKKILEWSPTPEQAVDTAMYLNDHYSIDGGDPNGYVGILWSIAGVHDRPWFERSIYGKIRYMNESGLRRKFNIDTYINTWAHPIA